VSSSPHHIPVDSASIYRNVFFIFAVRRPILEAQISIDLHPPLDLVLSPYYIRSTFVMKNIMLRLVFIYTVGRTCTRTSLVLLKGSTCGKPQCQRHHLQYHSLDHLGLRTSNQSINVLVSLESIEPDHRLRRSQPRRRSNPHLEGPPQLQGTPHPVAQSQSIFGCGSARYALSGRHHRGQHQSHARFIRGAQKLICDIKTLVDASYIFRINVSSSGYSSA
jgi:hypothetical protein